MSWHGEQELNWALLRETVVYEGYTTVLRRTFRMPDGSVADWDVVAAGRSVAVLARTVSGDFLLVRQFRAGPQRVLLELPGGFVGADETVMDAARRELREETGFEAGLDGGRRTQLVGSELPTRAVLRPRPGL